MIVPTATYRLQFRNGTDFAAAERLVPYWRELGISHLYASPVFTAVTGSTHGYDVTNQNEIDPALGGRGGFESLSRALRDAGMGILLDIVPNHMAASLENPWWRDVVQWGSESRFAGHFDIDWSRPLTLPVLGCTFEEALGAGELSLIAEREAGTLALAYFESHFPLHPGSWEMLLTDAEGDVRRLADMARGARPSDGDALREAVLTLTKTPSASQLDRHLAALSGDGAMMRRLHERQPWRLDFWKEASRNLSYRRFFEITGLVGLAVEKEEVFDDAHALALELLQERLIDGLRIDHVDGMADPGGYLRRLRGKAGDDAYIVVEKILGPGELLPPDWPVAGTTGYEFIEAAADLLVDPQGPEQLSRAYERMTGGAPTDILRRQSKHQIITRNFEGELEQLVSLFASLAGPPERAELKQAIIELLIAMPVYRTYGASGALNGTDRAVVLAARDAAAEAHPSLSRRALDFVAETLISGDGGDAPAAAKARMRFQQLSGPAMAKGIEDTLFYRDHRFLALNEVGGEPGRGEFSRERFHAAMAERAQRAPHALTATATHDTKRGEDARARLYALSEAPERWIELVERWRRRHRDSVSELPAGPAPEPQLEWMLYQTLAGLWPDTLPGDPSALDDMRSRFMAYVEKMLREAKTRTSWTEVDETYEKAVSAYAARLLDPQNIAFLSEMSDAVIPIRRAGWLNSLTQTLVKLTAPGVPDIYQGSEGVDLSLVDPDNRRPVDWRALQHTPMVDAASFADPRFKQFMVRRVLAARRAHPEVFTDGDYRRLGVTGAASRHLVAYARRSSDTEVIVLAPRLTLSLLDGREEPDAEAWRNAMMEWPDDAGERRWREVLSGTIYHAPVPVAELLGRWPYAVLVGTSRHFSLGTRK